MRGRYFLADDGFALQLKGKTYPVAFAA